VTLVLSNDDVAALLAMSECVEALEQAYRAAAEGAALSAPRRDVLVPGPLPATYHGLKTMSGSVPGEQVAAVRLNSDIVSWPVRDGTMRREKIPLADGRWVGLVLLFSTQTGEPLAIMPDGVLQRMRVGATNGLGAKYLARPDARVVGLLGSGWQAGSQVEAMCAVRAIRTVRVYSPNPEHRLAFAEQESARIGVEIIPVPRPEDAVRDADIVVAATNSLEPVVQTTWVEPGMHLTSIRHSELDAPTLRRCDVLAVHARQPALLTIRPGEEERVPEFRHGDYRMPDLEAAGIRYESLPDLPDLVAGRVRGRETPEQVTAFLNFIGLGLQFAAAGARVCARARERGVGRELPSEWFTQTVHP
jgi:ornithine cyclodeaminase/alanine dehydrogenase-like protein (mu-crystallin family)